MVRNWKTPPNRMTHRAWRPNNRYRHGGYGPMRRAMGYGLRMARFAGDDFAENHPGRVRARANWARIMPSLRQAPRPAGTPGYSVYRSGFHIGRGKQRRYRTDKVNKRKALFWNPDNPRGYVRNIRRKYDWNRGL